VISRCLRRSALVLSVVLLVVAPALFFGSLIGWTWLRSDEYLRLGSIAAVAAASAAGCLVATTQRPSSVLALVLVATAAGEAGGLLYLGFGAIFNIPWAS